MICFFLLAKNEFNRSNSRSTPNFTHSIAKPWYSNLPSTAHLSLTNSNLSSELFFSLIWKTKLSCPWVTEDPPKKLPARGQCQFRCPYKVPSGFELLLVGSCFLWRKNSSTVRTEGHKYRSFWRRLELHCLSHSLLEKGCLLPRPHSHQSAAQSPLYDSCWRNHKPGTLFYRRPQKLWNHQDSHVGHWPSLWPRWLDPRGLDSQQLTDLRLNGPSWFGLTATNRSASK